MSPSRGRLTGANGSYRLAVASHSPSHAGGTSPELTFLTRFRGWFGRFFGVWFAIDGGQTIRPRSGSS